MDDLKDIEFENDEQRKAFEMQEDLLAQEELNLNSVRMYLKEISKYKLLKTKHEVRYFGMMKDYQKRRLLKIRSSTKNVKYNIYNLNLILLFKSMVNCDSYKLIIDSLLSLYNNIELTNTKEFKVLTKYQELSNKLGRALNDVELERVFKIKQDSNIDLIPSDELLNEVRDYMKFRYAYHKVFTSNLRLVVYFAKYKARKCDIPLLDLITDGNFGLMRAIDLFEIERGNKFSSYASRCIKDALNKTILFNNDAISLPINYKREQKKFFYQVSELEKEAKRTLTYEEISEALNIPVEQVKEYYDNNYSYVSQNKSVGEEEDCELVDFIPDHVNGFESVYDKALQEEIKVLYECLTEREALVVQMCFGIGKYKNNKLTLTDAGKVINVTHESVRQTLARARYKMILYTKRNEKAGALRDFWR